jgi:hypothetical protein
VFYPEIQEWLPISKQTVTIKYYWKTQDILSISKYTKKWSARCDAVCQLLKEF